MERIKELKNRYQTFFENISQWSASCFGPTKFLSVEDVVSYFRVESETNKTSLDLLVELLQCDTKPEILTWIADLTGLRLIGYQFAHLWATTESKFDLVLMISVNKKNQNLKPSIANSLAMWGIQVEPSSVQNILSSTQRKLAIINVSLQQLQYIESMQRWIEYFSKEGFEIVLVTDGSTSDASKKFCTSTLFKEFKEFKLSLNPFNLRISHCNEEKYSVGADVLLSHARHVTATCFYTSANGTVEHYKNWYTEFESYAKGNVELKREKFVLLHTHPQLTGQNLFQDIAFTNNCLTSPVQWFSAAATGPCPSNKAKYATYQVGDYLLVRDLKTDYIAITIFQNEKNHITNILDEDSINLLNKVRNTKDFSDLTNDQLMQALMKSVKSLKQIKKGDLSKQCKGTIRALKIALSKKDPKKKYGGMFSADCKHKLHYHTIQENITKCQSDKDAALICDTIRNILKGEKAPIDFNSKEYENLVLGVAASFISETHRYVLSFITTLCLLDLIGEANGKEVYSQLFAHPEHTNGNTNTTDTDNGGTNTTEVDNEIYLEGTNTDAKQFDPSRSIFQMQQDVAASLGGFQVMTQSGSFKQQELEKPMQGFTWTDFKVHLILLRWLQLCVERERHIVPHISSQIDHGKHTVHANDIYFNLAAHEVGIFNINIFDRFYRRTQSFDQMLQTKKSLYDCWVDNQNVPFTEFLSSYCASTPTYVKSGLGPWTGDPEGCDIRGYIDKMVICTLTNRLAFYFGVNPTTRNEVYVSPLAKNDEVVEVDTQKDNETKLNMLLAAKEIEPRFGDKLLEDFSQKIDTSLVTLTIELSD